MLRGVLSYRRGSHLLELSYRGSEAGVTLVFFLGGWGLGVGGGVFGKGCVLLYVAVDINVNCQA